MLRALIGIKGSAALTREQAGTATGALRQAEADNLQALPPSEHFRIEQSVGRHIRAAYPHTMERLML